MTQDVRSGARRVRRVAQRANRPARESSRVNVDFIRQPVHLDLLRAVVKDHQLAGMIGLSAVAADGTLYHRLTARAEHPRRYGQIQFHSYHEVTVVSDV